MTDLLLLIIAIGIFFNILSNKKSLKTYADILKEEEYRRKAVNEINVKEEFIKEEKEYQKFDQEREKENKIIIENKSKFNDLANIYPDLPDYVYKYIDSIQKKDDDIYYIYFNDDFPKVLLEAINEELEYLDSLDGLLRVFSNDEYTQSFEYYNLTLINNEFEKTKWFHDDNYHHDSGFDRYIRLAFNKPDSNGKYKLITSIIFRFCTEPIEDNKDRDHDVLNRNNLYPLHKKSFDFAELNYKCFYYAIFGFNLEGDYYPKKDVIFAIKKAIKRNYTGYSGINIRSISDDYAYFTTCILEGDIDKKAVEEEFYKILKD